MPTDKVILETGNEPEFRPDDFGDVEYLRDGTVRIQVCAEWRGALRVEYLVRLNKTTLAAFGRRCLQIAAETHNMDEMAIVVETAH